MTLPEITNKEGMENKSVLTPSKDLAWMIGALAGGGSVQLASNSAHIMLSGDSQKEEALIKRFQTVGEQIFRLNSRKYPKHTKDGRERVTTAFFSVAIATAIGDLRSTEWNHTIRQQHEWLVNNPQYSWSFLEGLFDTRGFIRAEKGRGRLGFAIFHVETANFTTELLTRVGIQNPKYSRDKSQREGIRGVVVENIRDLRSFAENIRSLIPTKEKALAFFRELPPSSTPDHHYNRHFPTSLSELVGEWRKLQELFGRVPRRNEINRLRTTGQTKFTSDVYTTRFSANNSFTETTFAIEELIKRGARPTQEELNNFLSEYQRGRSAYTLRLAQSPNDEARRRLDNILGIKQPEFIHQGLFGPDGKTVILAPLKRKKQSKIRQPQVQLPNDNQSNVEPSPVVTTEEQINSTLDLDPLPNTKEIFWDLGFLSRRVFYMLYQSTEPIPSTNLVRTIYGNGANLDIGRQKLRALIYKALNPIIKPKGYLVVNTNTVKSHREGLYTLDITDSANTSSSNPDYAQLIKWDESKGIFGTVLPDGDIFKNEDLAKVRLVAKLIFSRQDVQIEDLSTDFYGEYSKKTADNVMHLVRKVNGLLQPLKWQIVQTTTSRESSNGQRAKYSLIKVTN